MFNVNIVDSPPVFTALPATGSNIFDGLKQATETLHTFSVTDSDDTVTCSARAPENALSEVVAGVAPRFTVNVRMGVTLRAENGPYVINVDCSDGDNDVTATFTQPVMDTPPTVTLLGKFTTTDPDTARSMTSPSTTVYEIRNVTSPVNVSQPGNPPVRGNIGERCLPDNTKMLALYKVNPNAEWVLKHRQRMKAD
ncbi:hypothetical protein DPMN_018986 [Dreissena polymorpha]|uniref:RHG40/28/18 C-terminal ubiquitin-like domain-containing protein n=1 Tax=Dreissena polymorpha TaxID=45954 RepID=A0A9D4S9R1_DREPO|nr:hypothetical protein DPMN_018986 [Dreissena polymorpha]